MPRLQIFFGRSRQAGRRPLPENRVPRRPLHQPAAPFALMMAHDSSTQENSGMACPSTLKSRGTELYTAVHLTEILINNAQFRPRATRSRPLQCTATGRLSRVDGHDLVGRYRLSPPPRPLEPPQGSAHQPNKSRANAGSCRAAAPPPACALGPGTSVRLYLD